MFYETKTIMTQDEYCRIKPVINNYLDYIADFYYENNCLSILFNNLNKRDEFISDINIKRTHEKEIKVKLLNKDAKLTIGKSNEWVDINIPCNFKYKTGESYLIHLGFSCKLPTGYEAIIAPRSSLFYYTGLLLTNGIGVIDNRYCGNNDEWKALLYATKDGEIEKGRRILQFRIQKQQPDIKLTYTDNLSNKNRGGFGSTGMF